MKFFGISIYYLVFSNNLSISYNNSSINFNNPCVNINFVLV